MKPNVKYHVTRGTANGLLHPGDELIYEYGQLKLKSNWDGLQYTFGRNAGEIIKGVEMEPVEDVLDVTDDYMADLEKRFGTVKYVAETEAMEPEFLRGTK
jgi:hypothetical protein